LRFKEVGTQAAGVYLKDSPADNLKKLKWIKSSLVENPSPFLPNYLSARNRHEVKKYT